MSDVILSRKQSQVFGYVYGSRLFKHTGNINQIHKYIILLLRKDKNTRRAVVTLFDPQRDSFIDHSDVPGLICIDFKIRDNRLNITATIRSNDIFVGWPANIYQLFMLQDYVAARLDIKIGSITTFSTSAHIFDEHINMINRIIEH
jgi:thymidylate synthase